MALGNTRVVAIEEHYWDPEVAKRFDGADARAPRVRMRLDNLGELRLQEMDEAGIDLQVISHGAPATQRMEPMAAVELARQANDHLHEVVLSKPERFAAFATLPTPDPAAAADELERAVTTLGFVGAMVHGPTNGVFFDDKRFWPICERAQALDVPLYIHPSAPHPAVVEAYYKDYLADFPGLLSSAWGFTVETATQGIRMILSGMFEAYPNLKIILGHLGESLPFSLWRIDAGLARNGKKPASFRELFCRHFWLTTSGNFSTSALTCSMMEMGVDRILFSIDYPFVENVPGVRWMEQLWLSPDDKAKILNGNATRLLKLRDCP